MRFVFGTLHNVNAIGSMKMKPVYPVVCM